MIVRFGMYKGRRIEYGEIINIRRGDKIIPSTFIAYNTDTCTYTFKEYNASYKGSTHYVDYGFENLKNKLVNFTGEFDQEHLRYMSLDRITGNVKPTFTEELEIEGMALAWVWLIFLMGITLIFKGFLFYWGVILFVFCDYRKRKLKENGYKP